VSASVGRLMLLYFVWRIDNKHKIVLILKISHQVVHTKESHSSLFLYK
jgi:hypothetical protein